MLRSQLIRGYSCTLCEWTFTILKNECVERGREREVAGQAWVAMAHKACRGFTLLKLWYSEHSSTKNHFNLATVQFWLTQVWVSRVWLTTVLYCVKNITILESDFSWNSVTYFSIYLFVACIHTVEGGEE